MIAGGPQDNYRKGAAWIFTATGNGWSSPSRHVGTSGSGSGLQGSSVSISADGNIAIVGGSGDNILKGALWVFTRQSGTWYQQGGKITGTNLSGASRLGGSVSLSADGSVAIAGGYGDNGNRGAFWAFRRTANTWIQQDGKVSGTGATGNAQRQGSSVALSATGGTALIGGPGDASNRGAFWSFIPGDASSQGDKRSDNPAAVGLTEMVLSQNIPNPLSSLTSIGFTIPGACTGEWTITDATGRIVLSLKREYPAGSGVETFDMSSYSGVYWYTLKTPFGTRTRRMLVMQ
jgi:hypothetical protein